MNYSFNKIQYHEDDKAQRMLNIFDEVNGQVNLSHVNSTKHVVAWHKHAIQTDYWCCVKGSFKVGLATEEEGAEFVYLSDKNSQILQINPGIYHGYKALENNSMMMYYLTEKYNPQDETRKAVGFFGENWETQNK